MSQQVMNKWGAVLATSCTIFTANSSLTAVNMALPAIMTDLTANIGVAQWITSIYIIVSGMFMILGGRLGDLFGTKRVFILGLFLWCVALMMAGFAPTATVLIIARVLGGVAFALSLPLSIVIITKAFPPHQLGLAIGINITITGLAQAIGPTMGGYLLQYLNWRWVFFVNLPLILIALLSAFVCIKKEVKSIGKDEQLDYWGAVLLALGLCSVMFVLNSISNHHVQKGGGVFFLFGIPSIFIVFYRIEKKVAFPIMDFELLLDRSFLIMNVLRVLFQFVYFALLFMLPLYFLNTLHMTPVKAGAMLLFMTATFAVLAPFIGRLSDKIGDAFLVKVSFLLISLVFLLFYNAPAHSSYLELIFPLILAGIATACMFSCSTAIALRSAPSEKRGVASGIFFTNALIGSALGVTVSSLIIQSLAISSTVNHVIDFMDAYKQVMKMCIGVSVLGFILAFLQTLTISTGLTFIKKQVGRVL